MEKMDRKVSFHKPVVHRHPKLAGENQDITEEQEDEDEDNDEPIVVTHEIPSTGRTLSKKPPLVRQISRSSLRRSACAGSRRGSASIRKPDTQKIVERGSWGSKWEFLLSCIGLSVGIGNVWRFPYLAYENGGGAFLIPYLLMLLLAGKPMYFMELAFGQFAGLGPLAIWSCAPICKGIGYAMVTVSLIICVYYNVIMCYTVFYMASTFAAEVPWATCNPQWANLTLCYVRDYQGNESHNDSKLSSQVFWERRVLGLSAGIEYPGTLKWDLCLCLLLCWILVTICLLQGIKTSGKVVYFAATFPYVVLLILLVTGLMQEGAINGVLYFITPTWERLLDIEVWQAAAGQMFFSLGVSMGALIMYSSYNDFRNNIFRDAVVVSVLDTATSIISGLVIFSVLGAMAHELGPDTKVEDVVASGPGLAFMAYPDALSRLPIPQLWSVLFFLMLFILGLDSEFAMLENILTSICDDYPKLRNHKMKMCVLLSIVCFFLGLPCVTNGGQYVLELMDKYGGSTAVIFIAVVESMAVMWIYGVDRFCEDIYFMLGRRPGLYWRITWKYTAPTILLFVLVYSVVGHRTLKYGDYDYPDWADAIGWALALTSILNVPFWAVVSVLQQKGPTLKEKFVQAITPSMEWGPSEDLLKLDYLNRIKTFEYMKNTEKKSSSNKAKSAKTDCQNNGTQSTEYI